MVKPQLAKAVSLGFDRLLADFYWLLFLQYYGDRRSASQDLYFHAPDYLKLIIELDPHFTRAYWYVSFVIAGDLAHSPVNTGKTKDEWLAEAKKILNQGIIENPDSWDLPYIAGFNQYLYARNQKEAARYYRIASKIKNAPPFLGRMAAVMEDGSLSIKKDAQTYTDASIYGSSPAVRENAREKARYLWSKIYYSPGIPQSYKDAALSGLKTIDATLIPLDEIQQLQAQPEVQQKTSDADGT